MIFTAIFSVLLSFLDKAALFIKSWSKALTVLCVCALCSFSSHALATSLSPHPVSYWIWAGIPIPSSLPEETTLYLYQGAVQSRQHQDFFAHKGLYPHPLRYKDIFIVLRIEGALPTPHILVTLAQSLASHWERHRVHVKGLQIDFDSPSQKLTTYKNFLSEVRSLWPSHYQLSITGLGDWLVASPKMALHEITALTDEVIFQLYRGRTPLPDAHDYVTILANAGFPFKLGLLRHNTSASLLTRAKAASNFRGTLYFLQK